MNYRCSSSRTGSSNGGVGGGGCDGGGGGGGGGKFYVWQDQRQFVDIKKYIGHWCILSVVITEAVRFIKLAYHTFLWMSFVGLGRTVYPRKYAHGFVVLCFIVVMQSFIMNSHEVFIHIHQGCFAGTGAIVRLPQCQWSKPDGYGTISQCITTTKHSKAKTVCIFLGIYCTVEILCGMAVPT